MNGISKVAIMWAVAVLLALATTSFAYPIITLNYPADSATMGDLTFDMNYTVLTSGSPATCQLYADSFLRETASVANGTVHTYIYSTLYNGSHNWRVDCYMANITTLNSSSTYSFDIALNTTATENLFTEQINNFWLAYLNPILGILVIAIAYFTGKSYSQMALGAAVGMFSLFFVTLFLVGTGAVIFIYAAVVLFVIGLLTKYVGV